MWQNNHRELIRVRLNANISRRRACCAWRSWLVVWVMCRSGWWSRRPRNIAGLTEGLHSHWLLSLSCFMTIIKLYGATAVYVCFHQKSRLMVGMRVLQKSHALFTHLQHVLQLRNCQEVYWCRLLLLLPPLAGWLMSPAPLGLLQTTLLHGSALAL